MNRRLMSYEIGMAMLAMASVALAFVPDSDWSHYLSIGIWVVFVLDYAIRFARTRSRWAFVRHNLAELLAALPWDVLRGFRLLRLLRLMRLVRGLGVLWQTHRTVQGVLRTNGLRYVLLVTAIVVVVGGLVVREVEPGITSYGDAIWWSLVTTATVGYGDIAPKTAAGRITAAILMLVGIGTIGTVTAGIATYFLGVGRPPNRHVAHVQSQLERWEDMTAGERREVVRVLGALVEAGSQTAPRARRRRRLGRLRPRLPLTRSTPRD